MSKTLVIVPCGQRKIWDKRPDLGPVPAKHAYTGAPFIVNRAYAENRGDHWVILSAKYGFISPDFLIPEPYNITFKKRFTNPVTISVLREQVKSQDFTQFDLIVGLGGKEYRAVIEQAFTDQDVRIEFPFEGLSLGMAMQATKKALQTKGFGAMTDSPVHTKRHMISENLHRIRIAKPPQQPVVTTTGQSEDVLDINTVWSRIENCAGLTFRQIRGGEFTYVVKGNAVYPNRTSVQISKAHFKQALEYFPLTNTTKIQHLRGPSYIFAILMDQRITNA